MSKFRGFTLVELMIALVVGLVLIGGAGTFYIINLRANVDAVRIQKFEQTLQVLVESVVSEIRRAGYEAVGETLAAPIFDASVDECLMLSHSVPTGASPLYYGFKREEDGVVYGFVDSVKPSCDGDWSPLTSKDIVKVTRFEFFVEESPLIRIEVDAEAVGVTQDNGAPIVRNIFAHAYARNQIP